MAATEAEAESAMDNTKMASARAIWLKRMDVVPVMARALEVSGKCEPNSAKVKVLKPMNKKECQTRKNLVEPLMVEWLARAQNEMDNAILRA